ncbi:MAG: cation transporter [Ardenticatenaceae bacterium]
MACEARVVSNLRQLAGIVSLEANAEENQLLVRYNADSVTVEQMVAQLQQTGDEVTEWAAVP